MKTIAFTGLNGVLGKYFMRQGSILFKKYKIVDLYNSKPANKPEFISIHLNLLDLRTIRPTLEKCNPDVIVHLAAITHIDVCEKDRESGHKGSVWQLNVEATKKISEYCRKYSKKLILMSTECVFDGSKKKYLENDEQNPKNWYGLTKAEAEKYVLKNNPTVAVIRGVVAYHPHDATRATILGKIIARFQQGNPFLVVSDQFFTPTEISDILKTIEVIIAKNLRGIFHVAPARPITPHQFAMQLAEELKYKKSLVEKTSLNFFLGKNRANLRLRNACLDTRLTRKRLGIKFKTLRQSLKRLV